MRSVRVWFTKTGSTKYISHLDLNRCMLRAVNRARLPVWYTEGFNPHPYITFALPLSLGIESEAEPMDIRIEGETENEEIRDRLNKVMPEGLSIITVCNAICDAKEICWAEYEILFDFNDTVEAESFALKIKELLSGGELTAQKRGKQGRHKVMKQVELTGLISGFEIIINDQTVLLKTTLAAGSTSNLNPALLIESLNSAAGTDYIPAKIVKKRLLKADLEEFR